VIVTDCYQKFTLEITGLLRVYNNILVGIKEKISLTYQSFSIKSHQYVQYNLSVIVLFIVNNILNAI